MLVIPGSRSETRDPASLKVNLRPHRHWIPAYAGMTRMQADRSSFSCAKQSRGRAPICAARQATRDKPRPFHGPAASVPRAMRRAIRRPPTRMYRIAEHGVPAPAASPVAAACPGSESSAVQPARCRLKTDGLASIAQVELARQHAWARLHTGVAHRLSQSSGERFTFLFHAEAR